MFGHEFAANAERFGIPIGLWVPDLVHGVEGNDREWRNIGIEPLLVHGRQALLIGIEFCLKGRIGGLSSFTLESFGVLFGSRHVFADFSDGDEGPGRLENGPEATGAEPLFDGVDFERIGVHQHESEVCAVSGDDGGLHPHGGIGVRGAEDFDNFGAAMSEIDGVELFECLLIDAIVDMQAVPAFGHFDGGFRKWSGVCVRTLHVRGPVGLGVEGED